MTGQVKEIKSLQERMLEAIQANDVGTQEAIANELLKGRTARLKVENEKALAEANQLAGVREELGKQIHTSITGQKKLLKALADVKAKGFTFHLDEVNVNADGMDMGLKYQTVQLLVQGVKPVKVAKGNGTGKKGGLQQDFDTFADQYNEAHPGVDIRTELVTALEKDGTVTNQGFSYAVKTKVRKWAIAQGLLQPVK